MSICNRLTEALAISVPIIQAPMAGGGDTAELVVAVSNAGGLGSIGAAYLTPEQIIERGTAVRSKTSQAFGINLFAPLMEADAGEDAIARAVAAITPYYQELGLTVPSVSKPLASHFHDQLAACLETGAAVFSFTFGELPRSRVQEIRKGGMFVAGTATTIDEAKALVDAGVDAVVAQGSEAGGHRGTFATSFEAGMVGLISLVPQMADAVSIPVIASGGIMDGRGIAAALVLGASAAQMGTAFLTCEEAGIADAYKAAILGSTEADTRITRAFSGRPARGIRNRVLSYYEDREDSILPFPLQNGLTRSLRNAATKQNRSEFLSLWAGQGTRMARRVRAAEFMGDLRSELLRAIESVTTPKHG